MLKILEAAYELLIRVSSKYLSRSEKVRLGGFDGWQGAVNVGMYTRLYIINQ